MTSRQMALQSTMQAKTWLVAPCGLNCGACLAYLREKNRCPGCRTEDKGKRKTVRNCKIKNCKELKKNDQRYCFSCAEFPCARLEHLDERYRTKYHTSPIENLESISRAGIRKFIKKEKARWACDTCGGTVSMHSGCCINCGANKLLE